jgi:outer membrane receptor protein involved in Fe transport
MPHDQVDLVFSKKIGERMEIKAGIKDLMGEKVIFQQNINTVVDMSYYGADGFKAFNRSQITKSYYPGRQYSLGLSFKF